jgi:hypothetical protein
MMKTQNYANRKFWTDDELKMLRENAHLPAKELAELVGKSEVSVDQKRRLLLGTNGGKTRLKEGWNVPSIELAYMLGAIASDGHVSKYSTYVVQKEDNKEMFDRYVVYAENVLGRKVVVAKKKRSWVWNGVRKEGEYLFAEFCSKEFSDSFGGGKAKISGDWIKFIEKNKWIEDEQYFWHFTGGLYDGDGSLARKNVKGGVWFEATIGVKPKKSREWLLQQLSDKGIQVTDGNDRVIVSGGQAVVDIFLSKVQCVVRRKKEKSVIVGSERCVREVSRLIAEEFIAAHHYLKTLPVGTTNYGLFIGGEDGVLVGIAAYGVAPAGMVLFGGDNHVLAELTRLVLSGDADNLTDKSLLIGRSLRLFKQAYPQKLLVVTYADISVGHIGRVYLAANGLYLGETGQEVGWDINGRVVSGRYAADLMLRLGGDGEAVVLPGKRRYGFILKKGGMRKKILNVLKKKYGI